MKKFEFNHFDKVVARYNKRKWYNDFYSFYDAKNDEHMCVSGCYDECLPYNEDTAKLINTTDDYEPPYEPKDGDFVTYTYSNDNKYVAIFECRDNNLIDCYYADLCLKNKTKEYVGNITCDDGFDPDYTERRPATEEEKQQLLSKLAENGKKWDAEKKEVVDCRYKPEDLTCFYYVTSYLDIERKVWNSNDALCNELYEAGNCFHRDTDAQKMKKRMEQVFKGGQP